MCKAEAILRKLIQLCSRHGYIHQSVDLRKLGVNGCYDYGPLGAILRKNVLNEWWMSVVSSQEDMFGVETSQLHKVQDNSAVSRNQNEENARVILSSPGGGEATKVMLQSSLHEGTLAHYHSTLQFVDRKLPFGLAQIGRCFRGSSQSQQTEAEEENRFIFRSPEFTQMMSHFYCSPKAADRWMIDKQRSRLQWWRKFSGSPSSFQMSETRQSDLLRTAEIQFHFPWGVETIERISNRGAGDLEQLQRQTGKDMHGRDGRKSVLPHVIEMVTGLERAILAVLHDAYQEKHRADPNGQPMHRMIMRLHIRLAPVKVAVLPVKGTKEIIELCEYIAKEFRTRSILCHRVNEVNPVIGHHLTRFDEMGIPFAVLLSENTLQTGVVRLRHRDTTIIQQMHITEVRECIERHLEAG